MNPHFILEIAFTLITNYHSVTQLVNHLACKSIITTLDFDTDATKRDNDNQAFSQLDSKLIDQELHPSDLIHQAHRPIPTRGVMEASSEA